MASRDGEALGEGHVIAGAYRLERRLGEGGMGVVWAARDVATGEEVALKLLRAERDGDPANRERLLREARAALAVSHPNVARVRAVLETDDGAPFLVMDLLDGESLRARLRRKGVLPLVETARILSDVAGAVEAAHAVGIVHRDLKPENVFVLRGGEVRVLDFGIAKRVVRSGDDGTSLESLTSTGALVGTPAYMAPEQIFADDDLDGRVDVWALGVVLYECLAGRKPTEGGAFGPILKRITTGALVPLRELRPDLPRDVASLALRMLSRDRQLRPSLAEVKAVLKRAAALPEAPTISERNPPSLDPAASSPPSTAEGVASTRQTTVPIPRARSPRVRNALLGGVIATAAATAWVLGAKTGVHASAPAAPSSVPTTPPAVAPSASAPATPAGSLAAEPSPSAGAARAAAPPSAIAASSSFALAKEDRFAAENAVARAMAAATREDGAACLRELDAHDRIDPRPSGLSTNPASDGPANTRATCMLLVGDCAAGKTLYRQWTAAHNFNHMTDEFMDTMADDAVLMWCRGAPPTPRDELLRAMDRLMFGADGRRKTTANECVALYDTVKRLLPTVKPRSRADPVHLFAARARSYAPRCLARAGDCAAAERLHAADYRATIARDPGMTPESYEERLSRDFEDHVADETGACKKAP
jgi:serine/threonine-protein kinase